MHFVRVLFDVVSRRTGGTLTRIWVLPCSCKLIGGFKILEMTCA